MKNLLSNPKFLLIFVAEIALVITLLFSMTMFKDKEIVMFVLGVFAGIISVDTIEKITETSEPTQGV